MNKFYFRLVFTIIFPAIFHAQSGCENANSRIVAAYGHIKKAYDSRNITDVKYFSKRSLESFEDSKAYLEKCGCEPALKKSVDVNDLLSNVPDADTYENSRFFVKRARDIIQEAVIDIDECSYNAANKKTTVPSESNFVADVNDSAITDLQKQQLALKQQQEALKAQEEKLKLELISQQLKKNRALIAHYNAILATNVKAYNTSLSELACNVKPLDELETATTGLDEKDTAHIRSFYKQKLEHITNQYLALLSGCN